jgi:hypothetical protein
MAGIQAEVWILDLREMKQEPLDRNVNYYRRLFMTNSSALRHNHDIFCSKSVLEIYVKDSGSKDINFDG